MPVLLGVVLRLLGVLLLRVLVHRGPVGLHEGVLSVRDHGPGFDEEDLPFVFDRFYRAQAARGLPGSGLGLAIVRQTAEACGGFVEAENAASGGALLRVGFGPATAL